MPAENTPVVENTPVTVKPFQTIEGEVSHFESGTNAQATKPNTEAKAPVNTPTEQKPQETKPPVTTEKETTQDSKAVSLKDYDKILSSGLKLQGKPEAKPTGEEKGQETAGEVKQTTTDKGLPPERDLTGFNEREVIMLKRMPYESYEYFSKLMRERKTEQETYKTNLAARESKIQELEKGVEKIPDSYYDNPNGFMLMPEFQTLQNNVSMAKAVENHWAAQLEAVKRGEDWIELTNDPKTGEVVYGKKHEYKDASDEVLLLRHLNGAQNQTREVTGMLQSYANDFEIQHKINVNKIRETESKVMPGFDNKESNEYKLYQQVIPTIEKEWGIHRSNPAFDLIAKGVALNIMLRDALTEVLSRQQTTQTNKEDQLRAGPTNNNFSGGGSGKPVTAKPTLNDYNKIINNNVI